MKNNLKKIPSGRRLSDRKIAQYIPLYLMLIPGAIYLIINNYLPMFGLTIAFKKVNYQVGILKSPWCGLENFKYLFKTGDAFIMTRNTILYNLTFIFVGNAFAILCAIAMDTIKNKFFKRFSQIVILIPYLLSSVIVSYIVFAFLSPKSGFINHTVFGLLHIDPINWYADPKPWPVILVIVYIWMNFGYQSILYYSNLVPNIDIKDNPDCNFALGLIDLMEKEYNIDEGRIFMQGMSAGNLFTHQFCRYYGDRLAGAAGASGPGSIKLCFDENGKLINKAGHLAIWQTRAEHNGFGVRDYPIDAYVNKYNRLYWMLINECDPIPQIKLDGEDNYAFYKGKKAPLVYLDVKNRDHGQTLDEAYLYWDYLFSGIRREPDGTIVQTETVLPQKGDEFAAAFTPGLNKVWFHNEVQEMDAKCVMWQKLKYHGLNGGSKVRGEYFMVPLSFIAKMVEADYKPNKEEHTAVMTLKNGTDLQFARGVIGCMIDDTLRSMYIETIEREGELLISVEWFFRYIMQMQASVCNEVVYVTDHHAELSYHMADLIKDILKGEPIAPLSLGSVSRRLKNSRTMPPGWP